MNNTHTLAITEGLQVADSDPEAVGSLGYQYGVLAFHLDHNSAPGLRANPMQKPACFSPQTHKPRFYFIFLLGEKLTFPLGRW